MFVIERVIAAVTPPESEESRREAREKAMAAAAPGDCLSIALEHHRNIETAFAAVKEAATPPAQLAAFKKLATILTGHSVAEEAVLYPALVAVDEKSHATKAYTEHSAAQIQMGLLEKLEPLSQDFIEMREHIRGAVVHRIYEAEGNWFLDLKKNASATEQTRLTVRYLEEFSAMWARTTRSQVYANSPTWHTARTHQGYPDRRIEDDHPWNLYHAQHQELEKATC